MPKPSSRQCYFGQVLLLSLFFSFQSSFSLICRIRSHGFTVFSVFCFVLRVFSSHSPSLPQFFCSAGVQNIVFYLIYLNTNRHGLVRLLPSRKKRTEFTINDGTQRITRFLFKVNIHTFSSGNTKSGSNDEAAAAVFVQSLLHAFFFCFIVVRCPFRNSYRRIR